MLKVWPFSLLFYVAVASEPQTKGYARLLKN